MTAPGRSADSATSAAGATFAPPPDAVISIGMALSSSSSLDDCLNSYLDNAGYQEQNNAAMARAFITACRCLLVKLPALVAQGGGSQVQMIPALISKEMELIFKKQSFSFIRTLTRIIGSICF